MYQKTTLDNGLRVVTSNMAHTRSVSVLFFLGVGSRYETDAQAGISHFIEHLDFKGTEKRPTSHAISAAIEGVGGILNGGTDKEYTMYWAKVPQPHFRLALDVLVDMVLHSKYDAEELERERNVIIEEINMTNDIPAQEAGLLIEEILWPGHPLGRDIAGSKESMTAITRDMVLDYIGYGYLPENAVVAITGNITHDEAVAAVRETVAGWQVKKPRPQYVGYQEQPNPRLRLEKKKTEQAHLCLAFPGLPLLHPQRYTLDMLNVILGEGMSSRLFAEIRDKLGLAYSIHSFTDHFLDSGAVTIYAGVEPKNLPVAIKAIVEQLASVKETATEAELAKAKEYAKGRILLSMEDTRAVAGWIGGQETLLGKIRTIDEVVALIDAVTVDGMKQLARELLVGDKLRLAVVGPVADQKALEKLLKM